MTSTTSRMDGDLPGSGPWWRHPMMWLVVGGPGVVVVAAIATLMLAVIHPDPVVNDASVSDRARVAAEEVPDPAMAPAMKARNHAATGGQTP
jgi:hypothetical protein